MELLLFTPGFSSTAIPLSVSMNVPLSGSLSPYPAGERAVQITPAQGRGEEIRHPSIHSSFPPSSPRTPRCQADGCRGTGFLCGGHVRSDDGKVVRKSPSTQPAGVSSLPPLLPFPLLPPGPRLGMDEAEKYQQWLAAIAERRRQQEDETTLRRETEEEWLKAAQKKRKDLRDQWLSDTAPAPVHPSLDSFRPHPPPQDEADEHTAAEQTKSQKTPEEEAADARKEEQASQEENKESVNCTASAKIHNHYQASTDEDTRVYIDAKDPFSIQMAQRGFHESGHYGRSVLGTVAVQVERDHKTGTSVIRSVAPVSTPAGAPTATAVFDDGRKSIHAVGAVGGQPSTKELGQILSAIDGVAMEVLLDEVTVTPNKAETKIEKVEANKATEGKGLSFSTHHATSKEDKKQLDSSRSYNLELGREDCNVSIENKEERKEDRSFMVAGDIAGQVDKVDDQRLEEGPVTLVFMGYTDATADQGQSQEDHDGMITVERVLITDDGEEHVLGPETPAAPQAGKESQDQVFQDVPLEGNGAGVKVQGEEDDKGLHNSCSLSIAEGEGTPKRKTCQCCSVM
ncbi:hypothetical protein L3Q82_014502 [Scortum barcoo]|uniref:Uncharacterized protein n=1 Tax=Scortum barcoo TaxID=214431 RepID=A0ACB8VXL9_9TELE|nr:hypothetical protein L3Q82_014502 [Scortum barcoo]